RHATGRMGRLVGIPRQRIVGTARDLPAREVDRRHAGLHLLHRLVAGERAQGIDERLFVAELPELFRAEFRERGLDPDAAAQFYDIGGLVAALDALPAGVLGPVFLQLRDLLFSDAHHFSW